MKLRNLFVGAVAAVFALAGCQEKEQNLGTPDISISASEMTFEDAGGEQELTVTATRDWKVETDADWVVVSPESGAASSNPQTVSVTVLENAGMDRVADLKFTIGMKSKYLTVTQAGPGGSADALVVYANNFDKTKAEKATSGWNTYLDSFDGWLNVTGSGAESVTYAFNKMTARTNSGNGSAGSYSDYVELGASGMNYLWFGSAPTYFAVKNITLPEGKTDYTLSFGTERYLYQAEDNTFSWDEFKVYVSVDGSKWVRPEFAFAGGSLPNGRWDLASTTFTVPAGTTALYVYFAPTLGSAYAIDDLKLVQASAAGPALDFANGEAFEVGDNTTGGGNTGGDNTGGTTDKPTSLVKATIAEFLAAAEDQTWYELTGEIISIAKETYGNFTIKDETGEVYIYGMTNGWVGSNDQSFSQIGLKVGDTVTLGSLRTSYNGTSQGGGSAVPAYYISHVPGEGGGDGGETPTPPAGEAGEYDPQGVTWTLGTKAYDNTSENNAQTGTVNGVAVSNMLKLGTGSLVGDATLHVAEGTVKLGFYCVAWKGKTAIVKFSVDGTEVTSVSPAANAGATGNPPYTITLAESDYYEVTLPAGATDIKVETLDNSNGRVIFLGLKAITE